MQLLLEGESWNAMAVVKNDLFRQQMNVISDRYIQVAARGRLEYPFLASVEVASMEGNTPPSVGVGAEAVTGSASVAALEQLHAPADGAGGATTAVTAALTEATAFQSFAGLISRVQHLCAEGEATGVYTEERIKLYCIALVHQWVDLARQHLCVSYHWGDTAT